MNQSTRVYRGRTAVHKGPGGWAGRVSILATVLIGSVIGPVIGIDTATADEAIFKRDARLIYVVPEEGEPIAIWSPDVPDGYESVTGNEVLVPVPSDLKEEIEQIVTDPGSFADHTLEYIIILKGSVRARRCHNHSGDFHCHPPRS